MAKKKSSASFDDDIENEKPNKTSSKNFEGKTLVVVEAPGKVSKIQGYLGSDYIVKASVGHIMDLPKKGLGIDIENKYTPTYEVMPGKEDVVKEIKAIASRVDKVLLSSDSDREGEYISYSVAMQIKRPGLIIQRVKFNAITKAAITKAVQNPTTLDKNLVRAQQARRILDRLVGFKVSPLLWSSIRKGLSAGRVQSVGLRIIVDRQNEIDVFVPNDYWTVEVDLLTKNGEIFTAVLPEKFENESKAKAVVAKLTTGKYTIKSVESKPGTRNPAPPFTTSAMVQQASTFFGWSAKRTNAAAQKLYESGLVTYIRSDSATIDPAAVAVIRQELSSIGKAYCPNVAPVYKNKASAQEAHEAIRPTDIKLKSLSGQAPPDEVTLYDLIYARTIASQSTPAQMDKVVVTIENSGIELIAKGQSITFDGFLKFWTYSETKEVTLPPMTKGEILQVSKQEHKKHTTKPPARYNTASIIKELEDTGIGRPSTYQSIIETLINRGYVEMDGKAFKPTPIGKEVAKTLASFVPRVVDISFTAQMEEKLDEVAEGKLDWIAAIDLFWQQFDTEIKKANGELSEKSIITNHLCKKCSAPLVKRISSGGPFYACTNVDPSKIKSKNAIINNIAGQPFCGATYQVGEGEEPVERSQEVLGQLCPTCGGQMIKKHAKKANTAFWGCSNYSLTGCKTSCSLEGVWNTPSTIKTFGKCEKCGKGDLKICKSPRGLFIGCSNYPKCKNAKNLKDFNLDKDGNPIGSL